MRINDDTLLICSLNASPFEGWAARRAALEGPVRAVKEAVSPNGSFALGLRFSAAMLTELAAPAAQGALRGVLEDGDLLAVSADGVFCGPLDDEMAKERIHQPDWRRPERLEYTLNLARLMAEIGPPGEPLSINTAPVAFGADAAGAEETAAEGLLRAAAGLERIGRLADREIALGVEPEPCCLIETTEQAIGFFEERLLRRAALNQFALLADLPRGAAEQTLRARLGLCYDLRHQAVVFEDPAESLDALRGAGVSIVKLQLGAALRCPEIDGETRDALRACVEPTFPRQTVRRGDGPLTRHADLPEALALGGRTDGEEWRIRLRPPLHLERIEPFETTQSMVAQVLAAHKSAPICRHLELDTEIWTAPPEALRRAPIEEIAAQEFDWARERLQ